MSMRKGVEEEGENRLWVGKRGREGGSLYTCVQ